MDKLKVLLFNTNSPKEYYVNKLREMKDFKDDSKIEFEVDSKPINAPTFVDAAIIGRTLASDYEIIIVDSSYYNSIKNSDDYSSVVISSILDETSRYNTSHNKKYGHVFVCYMDEVPDKSYNKLKDKMLLITKGTIDISNKVICNIAR